VIAEVEDALDAMQLRYHRLGPLVVLNFDCGLPAYTLPIAIDLRVSAGYLVGRGFLFGPVAAESSEAVAHYVALASAQLAGAKLTMDTANVLVQVEEPLWAAGVRKVTNDVLRRVLLAAQTVALEVVSLATDSTVRTLVADLMLRAYMPGSESALGETNALASLVQDQLNQSEIVLTRRERRGPDGPAGTGRSMS
jgi:hypothetical protein